ncbi:sigma-70 family RNA polymerase sigma factor [Nocardioidaceae bacterium]|nr:sigma-70 family RNA polymerase sigma factor [Nocardioidaceae bacterium]
MPEAGRDSVEEFVRHRWEALVRYAVMHTGDVATAEDVVQSVLEKVIPRWHGLTGDREAYVRRAIVTTNISRWRRTRREHPADDPSRSRAEPMTGGPEGVEWDVRDALSQLTRTQRTVLVLRYVEDLTERETAELTGMRLGTVKSTAREALAAVRRVAPHLLDDGRAPSDAEAEERRLTQPQRHWERMR